MDTIFKMMFLNLEKKWVKYGAKLNICQKTLFVFFLCVGMPIAGIAKNNKYLKQFSEELTELKDITIIDNGQLAKQPGIFSKRPDLYIEYQKKYYLAKSYENLNNYSQALESYVKTAEFLENVINIWGQETQVRELCELYEETAWLYKQGGHEEKAEEFFLKSIQGCYSIAEDYIEKQLIDSASQYVYKGEYLITLIGDRIHSHDFRVLHRQIRQLSPSFLDKAEIEINQKNDLLLSQKQLLGLGHSFEMALKLELNSLLYALQGTSESSRSAQKEAGFLYKKWADDKKQQGCLLIAARYYEKAAWLYAKTGEKKAETFCRKKAIQGYLKCRDFLNKENQHKHMKDVYYFQTDINRLSYRSLGQKIIQGLENVKDNFLTPFYEKVNQIFPS